MIPLAYQKLRHRLRVPPSLVVLVVVLVLLHGVVGALEMLWHMAAMLLAATVGGGDGDVVSGVLWRTLPLALAAAGVTFAILNKWLATDSLNSYVGMAIIVLIAAILGNACYEKFGSRTVVVAVEPAAAEVVPVPVGLPGTSTQNIPFRLTPAVSLGSPAPPLTAWQRLLAVRWLAKPDLSRAPQPVEPLNIVPKGPGIYGGVGGAINQLLGYLVDYEPRLFLASIVAGSFFGWRMQRRVAIAHAAVSGDTSHLSEHERRKLAAAA